MTNEPLLCSANIIGRRPNVFYYFFHLKKSWIFYSADFRVGRAEFPAEIRGLTLENIFKNIFGLRWIILKFHIWELFRLKKSNAKNSRCVKNATAHYFGTKFKELLLLEFSLRSNPNVRRTGFEFYTFRSTASFNAFLPRRRKKIVHCELSIVKQNIQFWTFNIHFSLIIECWVFEC